MTVNVPSLESLCPKSGVRVGAPGRDELEGCDMPKVPAIMTDLPAGRELDELVAVRVLGAEWMHWPGAAAQNLMVNPLDIELQLQRGLKMGRLGGNTPSIRPVKFSAHIEDAWMIVEHLRSNGWSFDLCDTDTEQWIVVFGHDTHRVTAYGVTASHAIALCALRAVTLERAQERQK